MKKILIINKEMPNLSNNPRIKIKKNKTIIKDWNLMNQKFIESTGSTYNYYLEEWELFSKGKVQVVFLKSGNPIRPVHVIDQVKEDGAKALFQSGILYCLQIDNLGTFRLFSGKVSNYGQTSFKTLVDGKWTVYDDIKNQLPSQYSVIVDRISRELERILTSGYTQPIYSL